MTVEGQGVVSPLFGHDITIGTSKHLSGGDVKDAKACVSCFFPLTNGSTEIRLCNSLTINGTSYCPGINNLLHVGYGSFENEALEYEDRSTKHPKLENGAPKTRKRSTQNSKTKHPKIENEALKTQYLSVL